MDLIPGIIATTIALAALGMVFALLAPNVMLALRPASLGQRFKEPAEPGTAELWEKLSPTVQELEKLGLSRLGVRAEWAGPVKFGRKECCELASADLRVFASVGLLSRRRPRPFLYLLTPFQDGAIVFTATSTAHLNTVADDFAYGSVKGSPADLLQLHRSRIQLLVERGRVPGAAFDAPARLAACRAFYAHPRIRARMKKTAWLIAVELAAVSACVSLLMFKLFQG